MAAKQDAEAQAPGSIPGIRQPGRERSVRWVYLWLLFSSLLTVPWMAWNLNNLDAWRARLSYDATQHLDRNPTWSPEGARIAFVSSDRDGNLEIYVMNADGSGRTNLTNQPGYYRSPTWSPDGARIAFVSQRDLVFGIYAVNADGSGQTNLTTNVTSDGRPAWSPDGTRIAFDSLRDGTLRVGVMNADGSGQTRITSSGYAPTWSPDGARIAFQSYRDGTDQVGVVNADGSGQTYLTSSGGYDPTWSPDGAHIAFASQRDGNAAIFVMNADGSGVARLTHNTTYDSAPAWSPDGARIAFVSQRDGNAAIFVMNADGSGVARLTHNTTNDSAPAWSPYGTRIAFACGSEICAMDWDGTNVRNLSAGGTRATQAAAPAPIPLAESVAAVAWPGLVQVVLLIPLWSRNLYVRRHAQQAFSLAVVRILSTVLIVGVTRGALIGLWVVVNGGLWIFGTVWGLRQVKRGDCWLMRGRGEISDLPRPWAAPKVAEPAPMAPGPALPAETLPAGQDERAATVEALRLAFRTGSPEERQHALEALKALGEIEEF